MATRSPRPARILIPVASPLTAEELVRLGASLLDRRAGELTALGIVEVPEGMPLSEGATRARHARRLLQRVLDFAPEGTTIHPIVRIGRHAAEGIVEAAAEQEADLIIFGWGGKAHALGGPAARSAGGGVRATDGHGQAGMLSGSPSPPAPGTQGHGAGFSPTLDQVGRESPCESADLVVMGASAAPGGTDGEGTLFGVLPEAVATRARPTVVVVKTQETIGNRTFEQLAQKVESLAAADRAAEEARAVPARVERWFGESNFHHAEFADLRRLVQLKEKQGLTVSLVLPTLDEEETIGPIVRRAMRELMGRAPLLDEIVVVDSASRDRTREVAEAEGARVVQHPDVLTRYGSFKGKGEALWKSLYETTGDLIVWADTDVKNWHPRMVYGTLGPLLHESRLQYVKGYYQRPIVEGGMLREGGGGRVTELVARPLINLFYPELSGLIQPLSGEYAGRRLLLETIPFLTGYALAIGLL